MTGTSQRMSRIERLGVAANPPRVSVRNLALNALASVAFGALFPRLHHRLRWVARARPAALAAYVVAYTAFIFGVDALMRMMARQSRELEAIKERLRQDLGREPTDQELQRAWMEVHGYLEPGSRAL